MSQIVGGAGELPPGSGKRDRRFDQGREQLERFAESCFGLVALAQVILENSEVVSNPRELGAVPWLIDVLLGELLLLSYRRAVCRDGFWSLGAAAREKCSQLVATASQGLGVFAACIGQFGDFFAEMDCLAQLGFAIAETARVFVQHPQDEISSRQIAAV